MPGSFMTSDFAQWLLTRPTISAIVSSRVYPLEPPQAPTFPLLTYFVVDSVRVREITLGPAGKVRRRVQVDSFAETHSGAWALAEAVREALDGYRGGMGATEITSVDMENEFLLSENEAGTVGVYRVTQDFIIGHLEA